ncbi:acyltransferase family protein [Candidatus Omnitrophota bacterium]
MKKHNSLSLITFLSSYAITLIVLGHSILHISIDKSRAFIMPELFLYVARLAYGFGLPLFMAISGYLFVHTTISDTGFSYKRFITKKIVRLLVPYVLISSAAFIPKCLLSQYAMRPVSFSIKDFINSMIIPGDNVIIYLWFLPTLFFIFVIIGLFKKYTPLFKSNLLFLSLGASFILMYFIKPFAGIKLMNIDGIANFLIYFWLGCAIYLYKQRLHTINNMYVITVSFIFMLLLNLNFPISQSRLIIFVKAILGIMFSFGLGYLCKNKRFPLFSYIKGYSYQIFLLSWFFHTFFRVLFFQIFELGFYLTFSCMFISGLLGPVLVTKGLVKLFPMLSPALGIHQKER